MEIKTYDLEDRTLELGKTAIKTFGKLSQNTINFKLIDQGSRSIFSIGANYREANDTDTKKDKLFRLRISRKEAKESSYWLELLIEANPTHKAELEAIKNEVEQIRKIISAIIEKLK